MDGNPMPPALDGATTGQTDGAGRAEDPRSRTWWPRALRLRRPTPSGSPLKADAVSAEIGLVDLARRAAAEQRALVLNVIRMRDQRVADIMIPRADIVAAADTVSLDELVAVFREASLTRVPIYRDTLDDPIGFIHLKDLAFEYGFDGAEARERFDVRRHLRQPLFVPPSMPTAKLLERMQASRKHMALIIDEYGGVDGLVTIEDIVEQIVGDIEDEHDDADPAPWREEAPGVFIANARAELVEFEQATGVTLTSEDVGEEVDTLGGLVFMLASRVPERGEVIAHPDGHEFEIIDADPRRIKRLRVTLAGRAPAQAAADASPPPGA
jgi:magnesium and cobalt transporter